MSLPYFFAAALQSGQQEYSMDEDNARHCVQVLRMQVGEALQLTNGRGDLFTATITHATKKQCMVTIQAYEQLPVLQPSLAIAISPVKNTSRFEWFLEKAAEIGVQEIFPLICERTEKQHLRTDRLQQILIAAMIQSQQVWLPVLHEPVKFSRFDFPETYTQQFIAHCVATDKKALPQLLQTNANRAILIGPEGDFTAAEIAVAIEKGMQPVALGNTRLRTETAGVVAAVLMRHV
jgi:16S rRNA (uracil1498-N3)-methyltransferase